MLDPSAKVSRQLNDEPSLIIPYVDMVEPILKNERRLMLDPSAKVSRQLSDEPSLTMP